MADNSLLALSSTLIAGRFAIDTSQALVDAGGGIAAFVARDRIAADGKRAALSVSRDLPARARPLKLISNPIDNLMVPLGHGIAPLPGGSGEGYYIICPLPPGPPVSASLTAWPEKALVDLVLRPAARVLDILYERNLTHRAIRPNNVFQSASGQPVMLGAAWAAPPAMHQPAVFESPYNAMCHPAARGDGTIADDVYALGVLLLTLAGGKVPMAGFDDAAVIRWKLDLGSFAALSRDASISGSFAELIRGMVADEPEHRPLPSLLLDTANARSRRVAARPPRRSQRPLMLNDIAVFDARTLAYALVSDEKKAVQLLRNGLVTQWLRRSLGDAGLAAEIEELVRVRVADTKSGPRSDPTLVMQTISAINPRMPMCWRGVALWPDGLPSLLAEAVASKSDLLAVAEEVLVNNIDGVWAEAESGRGQSRSPEMNQLRQLPQMGGPDGIFRLLYGLNPLLPCKAPATAAGWVANVTDLMRFLEAAAEKGGDNMIDLHLAAFLASRADRKIELQVNGLLATRDANSFSSSELSLLRDLQLRYHPAAMPALAKWAAMRLRPDLERWRNRPRREALQLRLDALAQTGFLSRLLELTEDTAALALDMAEAYSAAAELATIDVELAAIDNDDKLRFADAERFGQAMAGGIGLSALILMIMTAFL